MRQQKMLKYQPFKDESVTRAQKTLFGQPYAPHL